ncbi:hypothetical protein [Phytomonospora endophytica]|uniref:DUF1579 domain-containing protein n=1 Tax=Phytomonospora endophytica TaxID=714109 RepID=A0A841FFX5_9ACTN|nr:hypothetical protein [Phytomonospora endophytica]MBB6034764.1 hypothetical protein [Phytomonospora endophytica]GIG69033.1 hypothetical protein Pen01_53280 [Phytomonospora endophytica]
MTDTLPTETATADGRGDFDFYHGRWHTSHRKLRDVLDPECTEWLEFEGVNTCSTILGGLGNTETSTFDYETPFEGYTLRLYDPAAGLWRIWWASTRQPGVMGPPVEGSFADGKGIFLADEELAGRMTKVRFAWTVVSEDETHWEQSFSYDEGATWRANWSTVSRREK